MLFMVTNRRVERGKFSDEERPNKKFEYQYEYNELPRGEDKFEKSGRRGFEKALMSELDRLKREEGVSTPKVGIFIHGFNTTYQECIDATLDLEQNLTPIVGYSPVIVGFSWPSSGKTTHYLSDREEARDSVGAFTRFLLDINDLATRNEQDCFSTTYCIAHSMGNYLLRKGMEYLSDYLGEPTGRMLFDETIMLAPDIASKDIEIDGKGRYIADFSRRVHAYYSKFDRALKASSAKRFGGNRLGRHGADDYNNLPKNVVLVDAKKYAQCDMLEGLEDRRNKPISVHSAQRYQKNILEDIVNVLSSVDRDQIPKRELIDNGEGHRNHYSLI